MVVRLAVGALLLAVALALAGWALYRLSGLTSSEDAVNEWFADHEASQSDAVSGVASRMAETMTCVILLLVIAVLLRWWLGRWREPLVLLVALAGEVLIFLAVGAVVGRERPDVRHLDEAPPTSSFPSGHTAAAVALYGAVAVIVWRQVANRRLAAILTSVLVLVPFCVGIARLYRGMHHPTDVLFGLLLGGTWLWLVVGTLLPKHAQLRAGPGQTSSSETQKAQPDSAAQADEDDFPRTAEGRG